MTDYSSECERIHGDPVGSIDALAAASASMTSMSEPSVGLLNLMPHCSFRRTEAQWSRHIGVDERLRFDDDSRLLNSRSSEYLQDATPFSEVASSLGALIISGANLELVQPDQPQTSPLLPVENIHYIRQLYDVIDTAQELQIPVIYSCLASHIALEYLLGIERERQNQKILGVFDHDILDRDSPLANGLSDTIKAPHSRWADVPTKRLLDSDVEVIVAGEEAGWILAVHGTSIFLQGHPEYWRDDLALEHQRDKYSGQRPPVNYYLNQDELVEPVFGWETDAQRLFGNIRNLIGRQSLRP